MNVNELKRLEIVMKVIEKRFKQVEVDKHEGLISKKRGFPSNHQLRKGLKEVAISLIEEKYPDFGPTLAQEKLKIERYQQKTDSIAVLF
jgi:hypothetical protein